MVGVVASQREWCQILLPDAKIMEDEQPAVSIWSKSTNWMSSSNLPFDIYGVWRVAKVFCQRLE